MNIKYINKILYSEKSRMKIQLITVAGYEFTDPPNTCAPDI